MISFTTQNYLRICSAFAVLLVLMALFGSPAQAQTGTSGIRGQALDPQGKGVPGALITLSDESNKVTRSQRANAAGEFSFAGLPPANYHLGLRPLKRVLFITEFEARRSAIEFPIDLLPDPVHPAVPLLSLSAKRLEIRNSSRSQALSCEQADFNLRLIEPASMLGCVMDSKPVPNLSSDFFAEDIGQGFEAVRVEVVHHQMDGLGGRVLHCQVADEPREFEGGSIPGGRGKVAARFWFYREEYVGRATTLVFVISSGLAPWYGRRWRPDIGMQGHRLLVQAYYRFLRIIGAFVNLQDVLHLVDVLVIEVGDAPHFFPATA